MWLSPVEHCPTHQKATGSIPSQGTREATDRRLSLCLSLSKSQSTSLGDNTKINKTSLICSSNNLSLDSLRCRTLKTPHLRRTVHFGQDTELRSSSAGGRAAVPGAGGPGGRDSRPRPGAELPQPPGPGRGSGHHTWCRRERGGQSAPSTVRPCPGPTFPPGAPRQPSGPSPPSPHEKDTAGALRTAQTGSPRTAARENRGSISGRRPRHHDAHALRGCRSRKPQAWLQPTPRTPRVGPQTR